jgi:hypothetical protein
MTPTLALQLESLSLDSVEDSESGAVDTWTGIFCHLRSLRALSIQCWANNEQVDPDGVLRGMAAALATGNALLNLIALRLSRSPWTMLTDR